MVLSLCLTLRAHGHSSLPFVHSRKLLQPPALQKEAAEIWPAVCAMVQVRPHPPSPPPALHPGAVIHHQRNQEMACMQIRQG